MSDSEYDFVELIGCGTFGRVHLVRCRRSGDVYVRKEVRLSSMKENERQLALTEVKVLSGCKHRNIIRYKQASVQLATGNLSIVMEYAEKGDLYTAIKKQKGVYFEEREVFGWFVQMTLAMQYIHRHNILHRDFKTQNIFLSKDNLIKVGDFGIARVLKERNEMANTAIGTPYYLSPEICSEKPYSFKSDIWALGCVLFELLCLERPFAASNMPELISAISKGVHAPLPKFYDRPIHSIIENLLNTNPEKRISTDDILSLRFLKPHLLFHLQRFDPHEDVPKKRESRRFSSNDILEFPKELETFFKRRSSLSEVEKIEAEMAVEQQNIGNYDDELYNVDIKSHQPFNPKETRTPPKSFISQMKKTYSLLSKRSPKITYRSGSKNNVSNDPPSKTKIPNEATSSNVGTFVAKPRKLIFKKTQQEMCPKVPKDEPEKSFKHASSHCSHSIQCEQCLANSFWMYRIPCNGTMDVKQKKSLRVMLGQVFGMEKYYLVYRTLSKKYSGSNGSLDGLMDHISSEQRPFLPLMIQLVQLDVLKK